MNLLDTQQKQVLEELMAKKVYFAVLCDSNANPIAVVDPDGEIVTAKSNWPQEINGIVTLNVLFKGDKSDPPCCIQSGNDLICWC